MNIFAIADTHLSFGETIDKPMDVFGPAWSGYEERLRENWTRVAGSDDLILVPGDISWAMHLEEALPDLAWIDHLPGKKLLLRGNHDLWWSSMAKMRGLFDTIEFLQNDSYVDEEGRFAVIGSRGWICPGDQDFSEDDRKIYERELLRVGMSIDDMKKKCGAKGLDPREIMIIGMTHFPPTAPDKQPTGFTDLFREAGVKRAVYGHLHSEKAFGNGPLGSFEGVEYNLVSLDRLGCRLQLVASL